MMNGADYDYILEGIKTGDETIVRNFYREALPGVKNYILKNSGSEADAQDIFQEALVVLYQKLQEGSLQLNCAPSTYIFSVCKNLWLKVLRRKNKVITTDDSSHGILLKTDDDVVEDLHQFEVKGLYQRHFQKLDNKCRELLKLFFSEETTETIMGLTGYTYAYVRKKKFECKKKLLESIEGDPLYQELAPHQNKQKG